MSLHVAQIVNTKQLQHLTYSYFRNMVCFGYKIASTAHEGDNNDDDDDDDNDNNCVIEVETNEMDYFFICNVLTLF
jgi:hypothetical protein